MITISNKSYAESKVGCRAIIDDKNTTLCTDTRSKIGYPLRYALNTINGYIVALKHTKYNSILVCRNGFYNKHIQTSVVNLMWTFEQRALVKNNVVKLIVNQ